MIRPRLQPLGLLVAVLLLALLLLPVSANSLVVTNSVAGSPTASLTGNPGNLYLTLFLRNGTNAENLAQTRLTWTVTRTADAWPMFVATGVVFSASNGAVRFTGPVSEAGTYSGLVTAFPTGLPSYVAGRQTILLTNAPNIVVYNPVSISAASNSIAVSNVVQVSNSFNVVGQTISNVFAPTNVFNVAVTTGVKAIAMQGTNYDGFVTITAAGLGAVSELVTAGTITGAVDNAGRLFLTNINAGANSYAANSNTYFRGRMTSILLTNSTGTYLFFTNTIDPGSNWNAATRRYLVPTAGVYYAVCYVSFTALNAGTPTYLYATFGESGVTQSVAVTFANTISATDIRLTTPAQARLNSGDSIQFNLFQQSGGTRTNNALEAVIYRVGD